MRALTQIRAAILRHEAWVIRASLEFRILSTFFVTTLWVWASPLLVPFFILGTVHTTTPPAQQSTGVFVALALASIGLAITFVASFIWHARLYWIAFCLLRGMHEGPRKAADRLYDIDIKLRELGA